MKTLSYKKIAFNGLKASALALTSALVVSCGSSSGRDNSPETTRPKTMDGITLTLPQGASFTFNRSTGTGGAILDGQIEVGNFNYALQGNNATQYPNINGDSSDVLFPDFLSSRTYTYLAVNDTSGVLTLNAVSINDLIFSGGFNAANNSSAYYFHSDSSTASILAAPTHPTVQMDVTFDSNGGAFTSVSSVVMSIVGSAFPTLDTTIPPNTTISLGGAAVPFNYNPDIDVLAPSNISPETLDGQLFVFTNGVPNPTDDFTIQFVSDGILFGEDLEDIGSGLERIAGAVTNIGVQYSWTRIDGTDNGTLILSGGSNTFDGVYELQFISDDTGVYIGTVDAGTPLASQVSGTFILRN